ncbi:tripartite tricarboxylate transporter permease [Methanobacterium spitsbergense]|uniref:Tripartite tricarboxylate transporter permease n=1 Tax=Methanobacterium spitsbergense TaxID=2874285 RepID=A0A8T5UU03_9EURY|nr:tripartite tricarboxylate transporter permease [Methanobacterium spitsbergense]
MFDILLACLIGVICGAITGIIPGIHVNTVGAFIFASSTFLLESFSPTFLAVFLLSMSISHSMIDFLPSIFLGVPEEGTVLSILPGHYFMLHGRGREAIRLVTIGGFGSLIVTVILLPLFVMCLPPLYGILKPYIYIILILAVVFMIIRLNRDTYSMAWSIFLFIFSGIMGWIMLNTPISSNVSLLTMFTGLFGISTLIYSLSKNSMVPVQDILLGLKVNKKVIRGIIAGGIAGSILGFLPGMGPAQGSILAQELSGGGDMGNNREGFLVAISGVNVSDALFSLMAIYLIGNPRSGIAVFIDKMIENFDVNYLLLFVFVSLTAVAISTFFCLKLGDMLIKHINRINYSKLSKLVITFMSVLVFFFAFIEHTNLLYILLVYITSISLGLIPHYIGVNKSNLMGVLIVPAIIIYAGL